MKVQPLFWISLLVASLGNSHLYAQRKVENFGISFAQFSTSEVVDTMGSKAYQDLKVGTQEGILFGNIPTQLGKHTRLNHYLEYSALRFMYDQWPGDLASNERPNYVHSIQYALSLQQSLGKSWTALVQIQPGLASDFQSTISGDDFTLQGGAWLRKSFGREKTSWIGFGLSYNNLLGEGQFLPILDVYWESPHFLINGFLPQYGEFYYLPYPWLQIGLAGRIRGNQYSLDIARSQANSPMRELQYSVIYGGPSLAFNFYKNLKFTLDGGMILNRTQEIYNDAQETVADFDPDKFQWAFFQGTLTYRLK